MLPLGNLLVFSAKYQLIMEQEFCCANNEIIELLKPANRLGIFTKARVEFF